MEPITLVLHVGGGVANMRLAPGSTRYVFVPGEAEAIALPLSRMAARRAKFSPGEANDVTDMLEASLAGAAYAVRNWNDPNPPPTTIEDPRHEPGAPAEPQAEAPAPAGESDGAAQIGLVNPGMPTVPIAVVPRPGQSVG